MKKRIENAMRGLPEGVRPPIVTAEPNQAHVLYEGEMMVAIEGISHLVRGTLRQEWLPEPRVRFSGFVESNEVFSLGSGEGTLEVGQHLGAAQILLTRADPNRGEDIWISGVLNTKAHWNAPASGEVPSVSFALTNFHSYVGSPIGRNGGFSRVRLTFAAQGWTVSVDEIETLKSAKEQLDETGGFAVTHAGMLEKDSGAVSLSEVEELQAALGFYFALLRGYWCGPVWPSNPASEYVLLSPLLLSRRQSVRSWFPTKPAPNLSQSFNGFLDLWNDADWNEPIRHAIWWYVEANRAGSQESSIVMTQAALELLGWVVLVEQEQALSPGGFNGLAASDKIRLLLGHLGIPLALDGVPELQSYCSGFSANDGPGAFTLLRNGIVHPSKKKRSQLAKAGRDAKWQARQLGLKYLELILLALIGYDGAYRDRTDLKRMPRRTVPWAE